MDAEGWGWLRLGVLGEFGLALKSLGKDEVGWGHDKLWVYVRLGEFKRGFQNLLEDLREARSGQIESKEG